MNVPKLRFKEFNDEWQSINLATVFQYFATNSFSRDQLSESGILKNLHYGDIHRKYNSIVNENDEITSYVKDINYDNKYELLKNNDLIFADASEDYEGIGKAVEVLNVNNKTISGLHTILARDNLNVFAPMFKGYYFNSPIVHNQLRVLANGFKVYGISKDSINKLNIKVPSTNEQSKIANTLYLLDKKIELQTKKIEDLKLFKKGLLDIIFNNNFINSKKLNELNIIVSDGNYGELYPKSNELTDIGEVPFIRVNNLVDLHLTFNNMKYITKEKHASLLSGHLQENDILITTRGDIGKVAIVDKKFIDANINAQIALLRLNNKSEVIPYYLLEYLNYNYNYIQTFITGSALKQLPIKNLMKLQIKFPSIEIQRKYSKLLIIYNKKIGIENQILDKLNELKKGLMQSMFV